MMMFWEVATGTRLGRACLIAVGGAFGWVAFSSHYQNVGARNVIAKTNESAKVIASDGRKARAPAERPGAAQRLRKDSCRDC